MLPNKKAENHKKAKNKRKTKNKRKPKNRENTKKLVFCYFLVYRVHKSNDEAESVSQLAIRKELNGWLIKRFEGDTVKPTYSFVVDKMIDMFEFSSLAEAQEAARNNALEEAVKAYYVRMSEIAKTVRTRNKNSFVLCNE